MKASNPLHPHFVKPNVSSSMVIRAFFTPPPRRSSPIPIAKILRRAPDLKILAFNFGMAEQTKQTEESQIKSKTKDDESKIGDVKEVVNTPPPPPPEKPLPDDCCGSGCVRCVWDMYYDELEEYNKLYPKK